MTAPRLGDEQLLLLSTLGCPQRLLVVPDKQSRALEAKGYFVSTRDHPTLGPGGQRITPAGLRRLADEMESGRLTALFEKQKARGA